MMATVIIGAAMSTMKNVKTAAKCKRNGNTCWKQQLTDRNGDEKDSFGKNSAVQLTVTAATKK